MKQWTIILFAATAAIILSQAGAQALQSSVNPSAININLNIDKNVTILVDLVINDTTIDDIKFTGPYVADFSPKGKTMSLGIPETFSLTIGNIHEYNRSASELNLSSVMLYSGINITGLNDTTEILVQYINLTINLTLPPLPIPEIDYIYKKCFIENNTEFCSVINISDIVPTNITIINETTENITLNILLPLNATTEYFEEQLKVLQENARVMRESELRVVDAVNESLKLQEKKNNIFKNAFVLEGFLKNPNNPRWMEFSPSNSLKNLTGFSDSELADAMEVLFTNQKVTQESTEEFATVSLAGGGFYNQKVTKIMIASTERLTTEKQQDDANMAVTLSAAIAIIVVILLIFYETLWKNRVRQ